jgi:hypothetical protein
MEKHKEIGGDLVVLDFYNGKVEIGISRPFGNYGCTFLVKEEVKKLADHLHKLLRKHTQ